MFFDRTASGPNRAQNTTRPSSIKRFPMPRAGLIENANISEPNQEGAQVLDNFYPTTRGARLRKGSTLKATVDNDGTAAVETLAAWEFGGVETIFAACDGNVFNITSPGAATAEDTAVVLNMTSDFYSKLQFSTTGAHYLLMANGDDDILHYDGTYWANLGSAEVFRLEYDAETGTFTEGLVVTGAGGATATIQRVIDDGTTGTLLVTGIAGGPFNNDELITDSSTGSATSNIPSGVTSVVAAFTGVASSSISALWEHKSRIWMIEKGSMSAWYLPVDVRTGAATEFPLDGVFKHGSNLLFGATWSLDSGDGLDDICMFATANGEVAVYKGTNPSSASTWALVGVYKIGRPLNKNAFFQAGGDLVVITDDGMVPISQAISKDRAALQALALTYPIEDRWRRLVTNYNGTDRAFEAVLWPQQAMLLVTVPVQNVEANYCLIANSRTGGWARYTGWDARSLLVVGDECYFGTQAGEVFRAEQSGQDDGSPYTGRYVPHFNDINSAAEKAALHARVLVRTNRSFTPELFCLADYSEDYPTPQISDMSESTGVWGTALWGEAVWQFNDETFEIKSEWQTVNAVGAFLAPGLYITSGIVASPVIEVLALWLDYEEGRPL